MKYTKSFVKNIYTNSLSKRRLGFKVFCLSPQRTGTSSFGEFFRLNGFKVAGWPHSKACDWPKIWSTLEHNKIFNHKLFTDCEIFEDTPWWGGDFYERLAEEFSSAKFVMLCRDPDQWWQSLISHSQGLSLERIEIHKRLYDFDSETNFRASPLHKGKIILEDHKHHYLEWYKNRAARLTDYFNSINRENDLFLGQLEDHKKWDKISEFLGFCDLTSGKNIWIK